LCWSRFTMAWAWWGKGDLARAREEAEAGLVDAQRIGESRVGRFLKIVLVQVLADEGEEDEAWRLAKEVHAEAMASDMVTHRSEGHRLYAYLNGRQGDWAQARKGCEAALDAARGTEQRLAPLLSVTL